MDKQIKEMILKLEQDRYRNNIVVKLILGIMSTFYKLFSLFFKRKAGD